MFHARPLARLGLLCALFALLLGACRSSSSAKTDASVLDASSSPEAGGPRLRATLLDLTAGSYFELVSEGHTNRLQYYSQKRKNAARKIQTNDVMEALIEELEDQGFDRYSEEGPAPRTSAGGRVTRSFEIDDEGDVRHWSIGSGSEMKERERFYEAFKAFLELYNVSASYQTIDNDDGSGFFDETKKPRRP